MTKLEKISNLKMDENNQLQKNKTFFFLPFKQYFQEVKFEMLGF